MKDLFFIILVVFSTWTFITGALTTKSGRKGFQTGVRRNDPNYRSVRQPAVSFSAGPAKSKCPSQKCRPGEKKKVTANPAGGCAIIRCIRNQQQSCPPVTCRWNQRKSYSGQKLANGCQEIKCINNRQTAGPKRRRKGGCPSVSMAKCEPAREGYCQVPKVIYRNGRECRLCPDIVQCDRPVKKTNCPTLNRCRTANFDKGECAMPRKDEGGCKQCPRITRNCDQIGGVGNQLG